jgi:hypothetical protein
MDTIRMRLVLGTVIALTTAAAQVSAQTIRIDVGPGPVSADGLSVLPVVSFDGRYTAFVSFGTNLVSGDTNGHADVFRYDRTTGQLARGALAPPLGALEYPNLVALSHDGRWLLFNDLRGDWVAGDTNQAYDVFLYDFATGQVERVSVATGGGQANGGSFATSMTPDGRYVAFASDATNLGPPALADDRTDVFVRDRQAGTTTQVSRGRAGGPADGGSVSPRLSPDGAWVTFSSVATNLPATPASGSRWLAYLARWTDGDTVAITADALDPNEETAATALAWNAAVVAVHWRATGTGWHVAAWDRLGRSARPLFQANPLYTLTDFAPARLSLHGRYAARVGLEVGTPMSGRILRHDDLESGQSTALASGIDGPIDMSLDGRVVVYGAASGIYLTDTGVPRDGRLPWGDDDGDGLSNEWEAQHGLDPASGGGDDGAAGDADHDGVSNLAELAAGTHPKALHTRYLAEGVENAFFATRLALLNHGTAPAAALVRFLRDDATTTSELVTVPAHSRKTIRAEAVGPLRGHSFAVAVDADVALVVDRTTIWDRSAYGGHSEGAVPAASPTWYFAEGSTAGHFDLFYLLENPNATSADATVQWMQPPPFAPVVHTYRLPPLSRTTLYVDQADIRLAAADVAAVIQATQPIFAERAMYWSRPGEPFAAGHGASGVVAPATRWYLAEGATGSFFETFVLLLNPTGSPAACTVRYLLTAGSVVEKTYLLPPESRTTIWADVEDFPGLGRVLANASFATEVRVTNGVPIVVERAMWWPDGDWREAHASAGATTAAPRWAFADGDNVSARTYVLLANTSPADGVVRMTLYFEDGSTAQALVAIGAERRVTVDTAALVPASAGRRFGGLVEGLGATPPALVVERVTYWNADGVFWAGGTGALASPLP